MKSVILILLAVATNTIPRCIPNIDGDTFCKWQAISFVLLGLAALTKKDSKVERIMFDWCVLFAINNTIDEIYRVALKTNAFEVFFALAVTLWTAYRLIKCQSRHKPMT